MFCADEASENFLYEKAGAGFMGAGCSHNLLFHYSLWLVLTAMYVIGN